VTGLWIANLPRPDHGPGMIQRECVDCGAGWVGLPDDPCAWCADRLALDLADQRHRLLWPDWMLEQEPRYDQLDELDQAVWDRTRGIRRGAASIEAWARRLAEAVAAGIVTAAEARAAAGRADRSRHVA